MADNENAAAAPQVPPTAGPAPIMPPPGTAVRGADTADADDRKKKKKRGKGKAILLIIIACVIGVLFAAYYFNFMNVRTRVISFFEAQDPDFMRTVQEYEQQRALYEEQRLELTNQAQELAQREAALAEQEALLAQRLQEASGGGTVEGGDLSEVAKVFDAMDKNAAAEILDNTVNTTWIANLMLQLNEAKAASILASMEPGKAALVTSLMSG